MGAPDGSFRPSRDLEARRRAYGAGARSGSLHVPDADGIDELPDDEDGDLDAVRPVGRVPAWLANRFKGARESTQRDAPDTPSVQAPPASGVRRVIVPGERTFRDGDRVRHARFGEGIVVTSRLTRSDEEVTIAFAGVGVKTLAASMAQLEVIG